MKSCSDAKSRDLKRRAMPSEFYEKNWQAANEKILEDPNVAMVVKEFAKTVNNSFVRVSWKLMMYGNALSSVHTYINESRITRWLCKPLLIFIARFLSDIDNARIELHDIQQICTAEQASADMVKMTASYNPSQASLDGLIKHANGARPFTDIIASEAEGK